MIDVKEKKEKIISFLEATGPSLPVRIAGVIQMEGMFASAILSELYNEGRVKMSNMRVGSSQLFFLPGQEKRLEEHIENLKPVEKEAYSMIKDKKVLDDEKLEPAIRVALSSIKDFVKSFEHEGKLMWKYSFLTDEELNEVFHSTNEERENKKESEKIDKEMVVAEEKAVKKKEKKVKPKTEFEEVGVEKKNEGIFDEMNMEFFNEVKNYLAKKEVKIYEEIQVDRKEVVAKISFEAKIGRFNFLLIAKNKKTISKEELNIVMQRTNYHKMPCLLVTRKELSKSVQNLVKDNNMIKLEFLG
ncbi:MAG: hypothetical protein WC548_00305 [Candidatus Pacearchaeota archaeon]